MFSRLNNFILDSLLKEVLRCLSEKVALSVCEDLYDPNCSLEIGLKLYSEFTIADLGGRLIVAEILSRISFSLFSIFSSKS